MEKWINIKGFDFYEVSDFGRIRSKGRVFTRPNPRFSGFEQTITLKTKIINGYKRKRGEVTECMLVALRQDGQTHTRRIHRLVLEAFVGEAPNNHEGCHNDGNAENNKLENLRWDTHTNNQLDSVRHGTKRNPPIHHGSNHPNSVITEEKVRLIKSIKEWSYGKQRKVAKHLGVSEKIVSDVRCARSWAWLC